MPLDSSIYQLIGRGVKSIPELDNEYAQAKQNKIALALGQANLDDRTRANEEVRSLNEAYKGATGADGKIDRNSLYTRIAAGGQGSKLPTIQKGFAEQDKEIALQKKAEIESHLKKFEVSGQIMNGVTDQATWDQARQKTAEVFGPEAASQMPAQYDPGLVEQKRRQALTVKDQLEQQWKNLEHSLKVDQFGETKRHNAKGEELTQRGQDVTVRGQNMTDSRTRSEGAANRGVTLQGQQLTDQRARDFNATKVEENNIKRDEKKATADLTKNSQIASFDTMLGTLDRLANHAGLSRSVGKMSALPTMPGSDSANFQAELNTFQSQAFLPMVAQLKGMGALSDAEGKKLTAAVGALDPKMGEQAFRDSVNRITQDMEAARERMAGQKRNPEKPTESHVAQGGVKKVSNDADFNALPSGAVFVGPDGKQRRKP